MIVSRGVFDIDPKRGSTSTLPGPAHQAAGTLGRGSVISLPYSNRTLLTNSSRSTGKRLNRISAAFII